MNIIVLIISIFFTINVSALDKIVMLNENKDIKLSYSDIEKLGGKIIKELPLINAVVVRFPDYVKDNDIYTLGYVRKVEDDIYIKWIEEVTFSELPSVESIRKNINEKKYDYSIIEPLLFLDNIRDEESKEIPWGVKRVNAYKAWSYTTGKNVNVAVIDTGIDYTHPDLKANYAGGYNAIDESNPPLDDNGHGTHVAGTIAAVLDEKGVVGVAPDVKLYAVKVLNAYGSGSISSIIDGIQWSVSNKIDVINMSLGSRYSSDALKEAVNAAYRAGIVIVCAAGNDGGAVNYPAKYPGAIAVSALDLSDKIASFSSRGDEIAFIAPGVSVYSTYKGGVYKSLSGTSMASPHVAGLSALVVSLGITNPDDVKQFLIKASIKLPNLKDTEQGNGVIDASKFSTLINSN